MNRAARFAAIASLLVCGVFALQGVSQAQVSNTWTSAGQMAQARTGAAAVLLTNGQILITGGADSTGVPQNTAEVYTPATQAFTAVAADERAQGKSCRHRFGDRRRSGNRWFDHWRKL